MRVSTASIALFAILLGACSRSAPPSAPVAPGTLPVVVQPAKPVAPPPPVAPTPPPAPGAFPGEALSQLLMCSDPDFLAESSQKQSQALQTEPRLHCQPPTGDQSITCTPEEPVSAFGLRLVGVTFSHPQGGHALSARLQGDMPALLQGVAQAYPKPVSSALQGKLVSLNTDDSLALRARESNEPGQVNYECRLAAPGELLFVTLNEPMIPRAAMFSEASTSAATPALTPTSAPRSTSRSGSSSKPLVRRIGTGNSSIAGHIEFPGESIPALHVCAFSDAGAGACVRTEREQKRYRIDNLPVGNYQVWAWLPVPEGDMRVMRAVREVQCVTAPCPPQPRTVALPDATKVDGVTLNDAAASYPNQPGEPVD